MRVITGLVLALVAAAACTSGPPRPGPDPGPAPVRPAWSRIALPSGFTPSLLAAGPGTAVLVAADGAADGSPGPRVLEVHGRSVRELPVAPASFYGRRVIWHALATSGARVYGFGGRAGGAHGNTRWTVWAGTVGPAGIAEDVQGFETFGGPAAGGLVDLVAPADGPPLLLGSRVSDTDAGLDVAWWHYAASRWGRRSSAGTPLAADEDRQPSAHGAAVAGTGLLVAGAITSYADGVRTQAAIWTGPGIDGPWRARPLPTGHAAADEPSGADSAACTPDGRCLVAGHVGDRLAAWTLSAGGTIAAIDLPPLTAGPAPRRVEAFLDPDGRAGQALAAVAVAGPDGGLVVGAPSGWHEVVLPPGRLIDVAAAAGAWWAAVAGPDGTQLWSAPRSGLRGG